MAKITQKDIYAIKYLFLSQNKKDNEIATELKLSLEEVNKITTSLSNEIDEKANSDKTKNLMIRQTSGQKNKGVSIMTQSAAQVSDEFIKSLPLTKQNTQNYIYRRSE